MEDVTMTSYYEDLIDVISWAKSQTWYIEPFILCGHSMGGMITSLYAEAQPDEVFALIPISPVVSGYLNIHNNTQKFIDEWKNRGYYESPSKSKPGIIKKIPWKYAEDVMQYDLTKNADKLTMPVLIIVGEKDDGTPLKHQQVLFNSIKGSKKELKIIDGAGHNFRSEEELTRLKTIVNEWVEEL
jgi:pimeloyl-ACP methyl ester carboxylesterase